MNKELLTEDEHKILFLLAYNYNRKDIAKKLNISYSKCRNTVNKLCEKFETDNTIICLLKAIEEGFIKL